MIDYLVSKRSRSSGHLGRRMRFFAVMIMMIPLGASFVLYPRFMLAQRSSCGGSLLSKRSQSKDNSSRINNINNSTDATPASDPDLDLDFQRRNKLWVVLVDDEESIRFAVGDFLYDRGYEVTACADAKSLLDLIVVKNKDPKQSTNKQPRLPDLIISDVRMPESDKNGYELVQFLRSADTSIEGSPLNQQSLASLRNLPIMLLTAKAMTEDRIMGYKAGADVVLPKPFSPEELVSIIDGLILRRHQRLSPKEGQSPAMDAPTPAPDLRSLKREIEEIKAIVQQNAATTVQKTDVVLADKERTIVELLSKGYTPREIASEISNRPQVEKEDVAMVRKTIESIIERTETESKTELIRWARKVGYIVN